MGHRTAASFQRPQELLNKTYNIDKAFAGAALLLYLAASPAAISAVLVEEKECKNKMKQFPFILCQKRCQGQSSTTQNSKK
jgi:hypothetical protein